MHISSLNIAFKPITLFKGQSNLKLGRWPVEVEGLPESTVQEGIDRFEKLEVPRKSLESMVPETASFKIAPAPRSKGNFILQTVGLIPDKPGKEAKEWIRGNKPESVTRGFEDLTAGLKAAKRNGLF